MRPPGHSTHRATLDVAVLAAAVLALATGCEAPVRVSPPAQAPPPQEPASAADVELVEAVEPVEPVPAAVLEREMEKARFDAEMAADDARQLLRYLEQRRIRSPERVFSIIQERLDGVTEFRDRLARTLTDLSEQTRAPWVEELDGHIARIEAALDEARGGPPAKSSPAKR